MNRDDEQGQHARFGRNRYGVREEGSSSEDITVVTSQPQASGGSSGITDAVYRKFLKKQGITVLGEKEEIVVVNLTGGSNDVKRNGCSKILKSEFCCAIASGGCCTGCANGLESAIALALGSDAMIVPPQYILAKSSAQVIGVLGANTAVGCGLGCCIVCITKWLDMKLKPRAAYQNMETLLSQRSGGPVDMDTRISQQRPIVRRHRLGGDLQQLPEAIELQDSSGGNDSEAPIVRQPSPVNLASRPLPPVPLLLDPYRESVRHTPSGDEPDDEPDEPSGHHQRRHQEQGRHTSVVSNSSSVSVESLDSIYAIVNQRNNFILSGYNYEGHRRSLISMQNVLLGSSERIFSILRTLVLQAQEGSSYPQNFSPSMSNTVVTYRNIHGPSKKGTVPISLRKKYALSPYKTFGFIGGYERDLEYKARSSQRGIITECCPGVRIGFLYMYHNGASKMFTCDPMSSNVGSVKTTLKVEGVSTVVCINPDNTGITGRFASCYNWGIAKNTRQFMHGGQEQHAKGNPSVHMTGGLGQVGYTLRMSKRVSFFPYIESTFSIAQCSRYKEHSSLLPCIVSKNREQTWERSIGLQSQWSMMNTVQIQTWVSNILGYHTIRHLRSRPLIVSTPIVQYEAWVPMRDKQYKAIELGVVLRAALNHFDMGCTVKTRLYGIKKSLQQQIGSYVRYTY